MVSMNLHEAATRLPALVDAALNGEEAVIAKDGKPMIRLVPYEPRRTPRRPGRLRGQIRIADDFDAADADILAMFEDSP